MTKQKYFDFNINENKDSYNFYVNESNIEAYNATI